MQDLRDNFRIERYKYVLEQKKYLNSQSFKIVTFYQTIVLAILAGQFTILDKFNRKEISGDVSYLGSTSLYVLFMISTALALALLIGGVFAWRGYRADEDALDLEVLGSARSKGKKTNFLYWYETYIVFALLLLAVTYTFAFFGNVISRF